MWSTATGGSGWSTPLGSLLGADRPPGSVAREVVTASSFSMVDASADPVELVGSLDHTAAAEAGMKYYAAAALRQHSPTGQILDIGCGAGHDLALLEALSLEVVGVDLSRVMLGVARDRLGPGACLARADGQALPFAEGSFDGGRIERVLMHVEHPEQVVQEAARCVRKGGLITIFEPDWSSLQIRTDRGDEPSGWLSSARHPDVGGRLWKMAEDAGCEVIDRIEELSVWRSLEPLEKLPGGCQAAVKRAVVAGRIEGEAAERWFSEQIARAERGAFYATIRKTLIVSKKAD